MFLILGKNSDKVTGCTVYRMDSYLTAIFLQFNCQLRLFYIQEGVGGGIK
jgi:hypothetical protein